MAKDRSNSAIPDRARKLVAEAKTREALDLLLDQYSSDPAHRKSHQACLSLKAQFSRLEQEEMQGILSREQSDLQRARINAALIRLIDHDWSDEVPTGDPSRQKAFGLILAAVLALVAGYIFLARPFQEPAFDLKLNFEADSLGTPAESGSMGILYGTLTEPEVHELGQDGRVVLQSMDAKLRGRPISFMPEIEGFAKGRITRSIPEKESELTIRLEKEKNRLWGRIADSNGDPVAGLLLYVDRQDRLRTDSVGNFNAKVELPFGKLFQLEIYRDEKLIYSGTERMTESAKNITIP